MSKHSNPESTPEGGVCQTPGRFPISPPCAGPRPIATSIGTAAAESQTRKASAGCRAGCYSPHRGAVDGGDEAARPRRPRCRLLRGCASSSTLPSARVPLNREQTGISQSTDTTRSRRISDTASTCTACWLWGRWGLSSHPRRRYCPHAVGGSSTPVTAKNLSELGWTANASTKTTSLRTTKDERSWEA